MKVLSTETGHMSRAMCVVVVVVVVAVVEVVVVVVVAVVVVVVEVRNELCAGLHAQGATQTHPSEQASTTTLSVRLTLDGHNTFRHLKHNNILAILVNKAHQMVEFKVCWPTKLPPT